MSLPSRRKTPNDSKSIATPRISGKMNITYYHRRPGSTSFSVERVFDGVRQALPSSVQYRVVTARFVSRGFMRRLLLNLSSQERTGLTNYSRLFFSAAAHRLAKATGFLFLVLVTGKALQTYQCYLRSNSERTVDLFASRSK